MSEENEYLNDVPEGYDGARCIFEPASAYGPMCGLRVWEGAPEDGPRCAFHSAKKPEGIKKLLEEAVTAGADLSEAKLSGTDLTWAKLPDANLCEADLSGAVLRRTELPGANLLVANLRGADLGAADLWGADLGAADLSGATLRQAKLTGADLSHADLSGADLCFVRLPVLQKDGVARPADLSGGDLRGARLAYVTIAPETILEDATFGRCPLGPKGYREHRIYDELLAEQGKATYADCAQVYRQLKLAFQQSGDYIESGEWYLAEMHCLRQQMVRDGGPWWWRRARQRGRRAWWWVMEHVAGYGERPSRVAECMAGVILVCALAQGWLGIVGSVEVGPGIAWPNGAGFLRFLNALYFSLITFTTTGYGDLHPANGWGRGVASLEALSGVLLTSLLLVCVVRKFSR